MPQATYAVVSDLHCRLATDHDDSYLVVGAPRLPAGRHPVESLLVLLRAQNITADALLIPGDLANRASREGLNDGWNLSLEIGHQLGVGAIVPVVGNHDISTHPTAPPEPPAPPPFEHVQNLRQDFPFSDPAANASYFAHGFCVVRVGDTEILALNSVIDQTSPETAKRGGFSATRIAYMEHALAGTLHSPFRVALLHHHPMLHTGPYLNDNDVIENGDELRASLRRLGCRLVVHGHKHTARLSFVDSMAVFGSGSFSAKIFDYAPTAMRNTFHIVHVEGDGPANIRGRIQTWNYFHLTGWQRADTKYTGFPYQTGFGHSTTIPDLANALIALSLTDPTRNRFVEPEVLGCAPDVQFLTPQEREELANIIGESDLNLESPGQGYFELWKEYRP